MTYLSGLNEKQTNTTKTKTKQKTEQNKKTGLSFSNWASRMAIPNWWYDLNKKQTDVEEIFFFLSLYFYSFERQNHKKITKNHIMQQC